MHAGEAPARAPGARGEARRRDRQRQGGRPGHRRDQQGPRRPRRRGVLSRGPLLSRGRPTACEDAGAWSATARTAPASSLRATSRAGCCAAFRAGGGNSRAQGLPGRAGQQPARGPGLLCRAGRRQRQPEPRQLAAVAGDQQRLEELAQHGIACIVAAGNSGGPVPYPASSPYTLAIGAVGRLDAYPDRTWEATTVVPQLVAPTASSRRASAPSVPRWRSARPVSPSCRPSPEASRPCPEPRWPPHTSPASPRCCSRITRCSTDPCEPAALSASPRCFR